MSAVVVETTTTTRTTRWRKRRIPLWLGLLPVIGLVALVATGLVSARDRIERDLTTRSAAAVVAADVDASGLEFAVSGRDVQLRGTVPADTDLGQLQRVVEEVEGVRVADVAEVSVAGPGADAGGATEEAADAGADPATSLTPAVLTLAVDDDGAVLSGATGGVVDDQGLATALGAVGLTNAVETSETSAPVTGALLRLTGTVVDEPTRAAVVAAARDLVGVDGTVIDQLRVGDASTADPVADGAGDGTEQDPWLTFFDSGATEVIDTTGSVAEAREVLAAVPAGTTIRVVGYADPRGDEEVNRGLSLERADAVVAQLREVAPDLVYETEARGESDPLASDEESRRVEFWIEGG